MPQSTRPRRGRCDGSTHSIHNLSVTCSSVSSNIGACLFCCSCLTANCKLRTASLLSRPHNRLDLDVIEVRDPVAGEGHGNPDLTARWDTPVQVVVFPNGVAPGVL